MGDFTQADIDAAVASAKADDEAKMVALQTQVDALTAASKETEVGQAVAAAVAEKETEISALQSELDMTKTALLAAEESKTAIVAFWTEAIAAQELEDAAAMQRAERLTRAKAADRPDVFDDAYVEAQADHLASLSDEDFAARLAEWKVVFDAMKNGKKKTPPANCAIQASREPDDNHTGSALSAIGTMRSAGVDARKL